MFAIVNQSEHSSVLKKLYIYFVAYTFYFSAPKSWDKTPRTYEITWPDGKKELWKDINARDCLTKYESMDPGGQGLGLREVTGKELQLLKVMNNGK